MLFRSFTALRHEALRRALALHGHDERLADAAMDLFLAARSDVELFPEVLHALERLAARYPLVALTNGNADIERAGVARFFLGVTNPAVAGVAKPDARIFHAACGRAGVNAAEAMHVGDHPDLDVRAAARAGLQAAWMNRESAAWAGEPGPHREVHDLVMLCEALGA